MTPAIPLKEFDLEMATTRRVIERVPDDRGEWKPHEKSFNLAHLAQLVSWIPGWITQTLRQPSIDIKGGGESGPYSIETTATLLAMFDRNVQEARAALEQITGAALDEPWQLKMGEQVLITTPRGEATRNHLNHLVHHRAQLGVYLRLLDVPVPQMYGPTADEGWGQGSRT